MQYECIMIALLGNTRMRSSIFFSSIWEKNYMFELQTSIIWNNILSIFVCKKKVTEKTHIDVDLSRFFTGVEKQFYLVPKFKTSYFS